MQIGNLSIIEIGPKGSISQLAYLTSKKMGSNEFVYICKLKNELEMDFLSN